MSDFKSLNLSTKILQALENKGYTTPTPIQAQAIPHILEGKDILGIAQTGTGKTAAFSLPILDNLAKSNISVKTGCVRVLVLTPTRELASQISDNIETYGKEFGLKHAVIFGGVSERPQITSLQRGLDILVATPGRLLDLTSQGYVRYAQLETFVLDEADRMLDMGFINDVKKIIAKLPEKKQTLFFSATMPIAISDLANSILKKPVTVEVTPASSTVERIDQKVCFVAKSHKPMLLKKIIKQEEVTSVLVFSKTKYGANHIVQSLQESKIEVAAIHGNKSQGAREKALAQFRSGELKVLVATDIAARGIDIPGISHVINYDIPMDPESYVHRIGRTARAGREGVAISFCEPAERKLLQAVEKLINFSIPVDETHAYHNAESSTSDQEFEQERRNSTRGRNTSSRGASSKKSSGSRISAKQSTSRNLSSRSESESKGPVRSFLGKIFGKPERSDSRRSNSSGANYGSNRHPRNESRPSFEDRKPRSEFSSGSRRRDESDFSSNSRSSSRNLRDDNFGNSERGSYSKRKSDEFSSPQNFGGRRKSFGMGVFGFGSKKPQDESFGIGKRNRGEPIRNSRTDSEFLGRGSRADSGFSRSLINDSGIRKTSSSRFGFGGGKSNPNSGSRFFSGEGSRRPRSGSSSSNSRNWKGGK